MKPAARKWLQSYVNDLNIPSLSITAKLTASQNERSKSQYWWTRSLATVSSGLLCRMMVILLDKISERKEKARILPWSYNSLLWVSAIISVVVNVGTELRSIWSLHSRASGFWSCNSINAEVSRKTACSYRVCETSYKCIAGHNCGSYGCEPGGEPGRTTNNLPATTRYLLSGSKKEGRAAESPRTSEIS